MVLVSPSSTNNRSIIDFINKLINDAKVPSPPRPQDTINNTTIHALNAVLNTDTGKMEEYHNLIKGD